MSYQLHPTIYSLLLCSDATRDKTTGGWHMQPFSEVSVDTLPVHLNPTIIAQIMAPPGEYKLSLRLFHADDPTRTTQSLPPRAFTVQAGKNVDFVLAVEMTLSQFGLHILEARLDGVQKAIAPLRITRL